MSDSESSDPSREKRKKLIAEIEKKRGSKLITYVTSDRQGLNAMIASDVVSIIHEHLLLIPANERKKLDLFIYSRGGDGDVPWAIVSMFREYSNFKATEDSSEELGSFNVLIPYRAHSAATVISLGADEIVMTKKAELGPIDATVVNGPYNPKDKNTNQILPLPVEDVRGYFSLMEKIGCERPDEKMQGFQLIANQLHPLALGHVNRSLEETKLVAFRLLNTRSSPFSEEQNHEIIRKLSSEVYSHNHAICRTEAKKYIGLQQVVNAEDANINDEVWELYSLYKSLFEFENPFKPEEYLIKNNLEEKVWENLNLVCVESLNRIDIYKKNVRTKKLKNMPSQVHLNLNNINFPVNIQSLPDGITQENINTLVSQTVKQVIQQSLNQASQIAVKQLMSSIPDAGFQRNDFGGGWLTQED